MTVKKSLTKCITVQYKTKLMQNHLHSYYFY